MKTRTIPKGRRATFVKASVLAWYQVNVIDTYDLDANHDPLAIQPGEHDGWDEGFHDELKAAFGARALEGSSDLLEGTIAEFIELIARQWDGKFRGFPFEVDELGKLKG